MSGFAHSIFARSLLLSLGLHLALLAWVEVKPVREAVPALPIEARLELEAQRPSRLASALNAKPQPRSLPALAPRPVPPGSAPPVPTEPVPSPAPEPAPIAAPNPGPAPTPSSPVTAPATVARAAEVEGVGVPSLLDTRWYGAREVDRHPRPLQRVAPPYPEAARRRGIEGWVKLRVRIDEFGHVESAEVVEADPPGVFDAVALETVRRLRFDPARRGGQPVRYDGYYRYGFSLTD